jgi:hypothetical protein
MKNSNWEIEFTRIDLHTGEQTEFKIVINKFLVFIIGISALLFIIGLIIR